MPLAVVLVAIVVAYWPLVTNQGIVVTDDTFTSDIANGEWPLRVEIARLLREGAWPVWTRSIYGGAPLLFSSPAAEPISLIAFALLSPLSALNANIIAVLLLAGFGAAVLARTAGASVAGAALAGLGYAFSGYVVCQLKHLGIVTCIAWVPWALVGLWRAFEEPVFELRRVVRWLCVFSFAYGMQWLAGFAQSAYISTWLYIAFGFTLLFSRVRAAGAWRWFAAFGLAGLAGVLIGAVQIASILEFTALSDRNNGANLEWATQFRYWLPNLWTFVWPYKNGDISDHTYRGNSIFWEDYSYAGLVTFVFAAAALTRLRSIWVRFWLVSGIVALLLVLGSNTPVFGLAFEIVPGLKYFRFPTRFLFIVHLALSLLAGAGLTQLELRLTTRKGPLTRLAPLLVWLVVAASFADLQYFQLRQNPIADAKRWGREPATATFLKANLNGFRAYSFNAKRNHALAARQARGWADLEPFYAILPLLQPDSNWVWDIAMVDGYTGLSTRATSFLWGSAMTSSRIERIIERERKDTGKAFQSLSQILRMLGTKYILSLDPLPLGAPTQIDEVLIYELDGPASRFYVAGSLEFMQSDDEAFDLMKGDTFKPGYDAVFVGEGPSGTRAGADHSSVTVKSERALSSELIVTASSNAWLVNGETFHPDWVAEVDGKRAPVVRVNINQRAVRVPAGTHSVRFFFEAPALAAGLAVTLLSLLAVLAAGAWAYVATRRPALRLTSA